LERRLQLAERAEGAGRRVRVATLLLIVGLAAGPVGTHVYWMLGGTWGLYTDGVHDEMATTGTRVVAAVVVVLLVAAVLVVIARVGIWRQAFVSERLLATPAGSAKPALSGQVARTLLVARRDVK
jgi:hypothetical protein